MNFKIFVLYAIRTNRLIISWNNAKNKFIRRNPAKICVRALILLAGRLSFTRATFARQISRLTVRFVQELVEIYVEIEMYMNRCHFIVL